MKTALFALLTLPSLSAHAQCDGRWLARSLDMDFDDAVLTATEWDPDGDGPRAPMLVVGGRFTGLGSLTPQRAAAWDGRSWSTLGSGIRSIYSHEVRALAVYDGRLIAGGNFYITAQSPGDRLATWDGSAWTEFASGANGDVNAMIVYHGDLVVAGDFTRIGNGVSASRIARWDGTEWRPFGSGLSSVARALAVKGDELFIGGNFLTAGGVTVSCIAAWSDAQGGRWRALGSGTDRQIRHLAVHNEEIVAGGDFTRAGDQTGSNVAAWSDASGRWRCLATGVPNVQSLGSIDGRLFAGADVSLYDDQIWEWDQPTGSWIPFSALVQGGARCFTTYRDDIVAAGDYFWGVSRLIRMNDADNNTWQPLGRLPDPSTLARYHNEIVFTGNFSSAGGRAANHITRWDGANFRPLGKGISHLAKLLVHNGKLIAYGDLVSAGGVSVNHIAAWDGTSWSALGEGLTGGTPLGACSHNGTLYAGGSFVYADGRYAPRLAAWNGTEWSALAPSNTTVLTVSLLKVFQDRLVVAGSFTEIEGVQANNIVSRSLGVEPDWRPMGDGLSESPATLIEYDGALIAGGRFTRSGSLPLLRLARWDGLQWTPFAGGMNNGVSTLDYYNGDLVASGSFTIAGGVTPAVGIARFRDGVWSAFSTPPAASFGGFTQFREELITTKRYRWSENGVPWIVDHPAAVDSCAREEAGFTVTPADNYDIQGSLSFQWQTQDPDHPESWLDLSDGAFRRNERTVAVISGAHESECRIRVVTPDRSRPDPLLILRVLVTNSCGSVTSEVTTLTVCGADFNCDGQPDFFDYLDFAEAFASEDPAADFNADGQLDFFDYLDFTAQFATPC